jgi:hypothetical protein
MQDDTKWHWGEGTKFATEVIKTLVLINGAASVSILTFIGNTKTHYILLVVGMACFAFGVATSTCSLGSAYAAQLNYGNASLAPDPVDSPTWRKGKRWHVLTCILASAGMFWFVVGVLCAAFSLASF